MREIESAYKYYTDEQLEDTYYEANPKEKRRISLELKRRKRIKQETEGFPGNERVFSNL